MVAFFGGSRLVVLLLTLCAGVWLRCRLGAVYRMWGLVCWVVSLPPLSIMFELDAAGWRVLGCCVT